MRPTVSVVLPAYNAGAYLAETLTSALSQTYTDFEILLLDNASTDNTQEVATSFSDPRLHYRRNATNIGFAGNVELGRSLATAPYVVVFNADDVWEPTYLERAVARLDADPSLVLVHAHIILMDEQGGCYGEAITDWPAVTSGTDAFLRYFRAGFSSPTMLMRNDALRSVAPLPTAEPWGKVADSWLFLQMCLRGQVGFIAEPLMRYRVRASSMMGESYADGSFFRRRMASVRDAFTWPEVQAFVAAPDRTRALDTVTRQAIATLPIVRSMHGRATFVGAFLDVARARPSAFLHPTPWGRLAYGLMPRSVIEALREGKRRRWMAQNAVRLRPSRGADIPSHRMPDAAGT